MTEFALDFVVLTDFMFNLERGFHVYKNGRIQDKPWKPLCFYKSGIVYPNSGIFICGNHGHRYGIMKALSEKDDEFYSLYAEDFLYRANKQHSPACFKKQLIPISHSTTNGITEMGSRRFLNSDMEYTREDRFLWASGADAYTDSCFCSILIFKKSMVIMNRDTFYDFHGELPMISIGSVISRFVKVVELKNKRFAKIQKYLITSDRTCHESYSGIVKTLKLKFSNQEIDKCYKCSVPLINKCIFNKKTNKKICFSCPSYTGQEITLPNTDYKSMCVGATIKGVVVNDDELDFLTGIFEFLTNYKNSSEIHTGKKRHFINSENTTADMFSAGTKLSDRLVIINTFVFAQSLVGIFNAPETPFTRIVKKILLEKTFIM